MADELRFTFLADLPLARDALVFAQALHRGQRRASDDAAFILHPLKVASLLHNAGHPDTVVAAGILHDTVENTDTHPDDILDRFGPVVAKLVAAMTEDPSVEPYAARKAALRRQIAEFDDGVIAVYAADKVAKVRELRAHAARDPAQLHDEGASTQARLRHYVESLAMLEQADRDHPLVRQLRFELEALRALPPRPPSA